MRTATQSLDNLIACTQCDLLIPRVKIADNHGVFCPRCGLSLIRRTRRSVLKSLVMSLTGLLLYVPAMLLPLITLEKLGIREQGNVLSTIWGFYQSDYHIVAAITFLSAIIFPCCILSLSFLVSARLAWGTPTRRTRKMFAIYLELEEWAMVEVYLLAILVTIFKIHSTAEMAFNAGFFCFLALVFLTFGIAAVIDRDHFWQLLEDKTKAAPPPESVTYLPGSSAAQHHLSTCLVCKKVQRVSADSDNRCIRCESRLNRRKPASLSRTWALIITSMLMFFPANLLPMMRVEFLGVPDQSTILDGILYFFDEGSYLIGIIILVASILVPLYKMVGLTILLLSVALKKQLWLKEKSMMFRTITFIGRWSMLDIYVIALLSVLVDFGFLTSIHVDAAATYFTMVVITTMLAAITFDPRILWDRCAPPQPYTTSTL